jgi:hypothetical protein
MSDTDTEAGEHSLFTGVMLSRNLKIEQNRIKFATQIGQYMSFVHKITALLVIHDILKSFVSNCGIWVVRAD